MGVYRRDRIFAGDTLQYFRPVGSSLVLRPLCDKIALGLMLFLAGAITTGCKPRQALARGGALGNPTRGAVLIAKEGCGSCHSIRDIVGAHGRVGPPLDNIADRSYIAGILPNTPENLVAWVETPQRFVPGNVMPDMGLSRRDAQDIAAYLYTLRDGD
jgi:cytochrome c2